MKANDGRLIRLTGSPANAPILTNSNRNRILIVEDNPDQYTIIQAASQQVMPEVTIVWATNAEQARDYLENCITTPRALPKLMLLDLYLPDADQSWNLLRFIKQRDSPFLQLPVVVISHSDRRNDILDFYLFGGTSYIIKPSDFDQWLAYFQAVRAYWWETVTLPGGR